MNKVMQSVFFMTLMISIIQAKVLDATYSVSYGIFGELGISEAHLETDGNTYTIEVSARTTGIVKRLSQDRQEHYTS
ncbi:MAG TPA: DUF3108 domain-containing protein, partial [Epsilonproteobacteria bacterium]|nr:DUF3108 domain-containing protein [Campylobacterota bacterium]